MKPEPTSNGVAEPLFLEFDDNRLLPMLFGDFGRHLARVEQRLGVSISSRGNSVTISGAPSMVAAAGNALEALYGRLTGGEEVDMAEVDAAIRLARSAGLRGPDDEPPLFDAEIGIRTPKRRISPRSPGQAHYLRALRENELVFGIGPAGTGKTYLAVGMAVSFLVSGRVDRLVLSRPAIEAGERLGFLPGDMRDKIDPYLRPLYDALYDVMGPDQVDRRLESGEIEVAPLAFMRGRTLSNAFVILDEAQNTTVVQMKMFLTRLGENARMVVTGDLSQVDLPAAAVSGLHHAVRALDGMAGVATTRLGTGDVVRHELVSRIVEAYGADASDREGNA